jgi:hypothetical protein
MQTPQLKAEDNNSSGAMVVAARGDCKGGTQRGCVPLFRVDLKLDRVSGTILFGDLYRFPYDIQVG